MIIGFMNKGVYQRLGRNQFFNYWVVLIIDSFVSIVSSLVAYLAISYLTGTTVPSSVLMLTMSISALSSLTAFFVTDTYKPIIRYSTLKGIWRFAAAALLKQVFMAVYLISVSYIVPDFKAHWPFYLFADMIVTLLALILLRVAMLLVYDSMNNSCILSNSVKNLLVYGVNDKAVSQITRLQKSRHYRISGCLTYGAKLGSYSIFDKPVYYFTDIESLRKISSDIGIDGILFPNSESALEERDRLIRYCESLSIKVFITPQVDEVVDGRIIRQTIREIKIEDLLGRAEININMADIVAAFRGRTILVTGAAGSIGSELCRQLATFDIKRLILFDSAETPMHNIRLELEDRFPQLEFVPVIGDVRIHQRLEMVYRVYAPSVVFHAAAYKHVPLMEENPCEAIMANVVGTRNVADLAVQYRTEKVVMVSTDKAVNPTNVMGASKRLAEIYCQSLGLAVAAGKVEGATQFITTRFGNVLGSNGSVIPRFRKQIENGGPVTVTHPDIIRYFMTIPEACRLVMEAATLGHGNEIFVFDMGEAVRIADLAKRMIALAGLKEGEDIKIEYTGLRPGEKLYEELLSSKEDTLPTSNDKIRIAQVRQYDYAGIVEKFDELMQKAIDADIPATVRLMKRIVPEYKSQNSRFKVYDDELQGQREAADARVQHE